jgi:flagellar basal body-associated protein FliL
MARQRSDSAVLDGPRPGADPAAAAPAKKKSKKKLIIIAVVVLLVAYEAKGKIEKPHYGPGAKVPAGAVIELGTITANLSDSHLAQIGVSIQMTAAASAKEEAKEQDELIGSTTQLLGTETYGELIAPVGRAAFKANLLKAFQTDLGPSEGAQQVSAVYFTSFVVQ